MQVCTYLLRKGIFATVFIWGILMSQVAYIQTFTVQPNPRQRATILGSSVTEEVSKDSNLRTLYPAQTPLNNGTLKVDGIHTLFYQEYGNPNGIPALFLHGGPGASCFPRHAQFFNPDVYRVVLLDQRGSGRSTPRGEVQNNTLLHLVNDCETLRLSLSIEKWGILLGGSWGSTLAIAYAQEYPSNVQSLLLRGVCLMRPVEIDWLFGGTTGAALRHKEAWIDFADAVHMSQNVSRRQVLHAYYDRLLSSNSSVRLLAAQSWMRWEMTVSSSAASRELDQAGVILVGKAAQNNMIPWGFRFPNGEALPQVSGSSPIAFKDSLKRNLSAEVCISLEIESPRIVQPVDFEYPPQLDDINSALKARKEGGTPPNGFPSDYIPAQAMLTCFYSVNDRFSMNNLNLLDSQRMARIQHIPCIAVHGGKDSICPIDTALEMKQCYSNMELRVPIESGHSMYDPAITHELVKATDRLANTVLKNDRVDFS